MYNLINLAAICLCVLPVIIAQSQNRTKWKVYQYPNPIYSKQECGRKIGEKSWICDPDSVVSVDDADEIQKSIENIYENTRCPCQECKDKHTGYVVMVALMNSMERIIRGSSSRARLYDALVYSYYLSLYWNFTTCSENILVLYSKNDDVLYTLTWKNARRILTDETVKNATISTRQYFKTSDKAQIGNGLKLLIQKYSDVLMRSNNDDRPKRSPKERWMKKYHQDEPIPVL